MVCGCEEWTNKIANSITLKELILNCILEAAHVHMHTLIHTISLHYCLHCRVIIHCVVNNFVVLTENIFTGDVSMVTGV